ncbi:type II secretion system protein [Desulfitobacterium chlororespirans]|uniref:General secretion pathway protein G n=1 Tax=Desulfitobacterium chlororespirans DSM 11544 TaxID=1121395 RepID=A0A1M7U6T0_9FIRM|nr:prepilin-type N-terminal cleavage/methylation domain-containing protein [Desulfitobacterium chlororespirans]SHN78616.1 general secretion pathway protein G [Desulfitobacterium chlororespirans DSM 11544]
MHFGQGNSDNAQRGFTLVEVLMVVFIIAMLSAIIIPKVNASSEAARRNSDIATGHQVKSALDRYQVENGRYPKSTEVTGKDGNISAPVLIPNYIAKLNVDTTQQEAAEGKKGFGIGTLAANGSIPEGVQTHLIMLYLTADGSAAEVRVYDANLINTLWSSAN